MKKDTTLKKHSEETKRKMSEAHLGKKYKPMSAQGKQNIARSHRDRPRPNTAGNKNWNWKGGISSENTKFRNSLGHKKWRRAVLERDNYVCQECESNEKLHVHHIQPRFSHSELELEVSNGITLCADCHRKTKNYGAKEYHKNILSVLKEIRDILRGNKEVVGVETSQIKDLGDKVKIYIPKITMKEIFDQSGNRTSKGDKLLYNTDWYKNENFFTTETSREGWYEVSKELMPESRNKNWQEQEDLLKEKKGIRLNAPEIMYVLWQYEKSFGVRLLDGWNWYWTSSRSSGGNLVAVGDFDGSGVRVYDVSPRPRFDDLSVCFTKKL